MAADNKNSPFGFVQAAPAMTLKDGEAVKEILRIAQIAAQTSEYQITVQTLEEGKLVNQSRGMQNFVNAELLATEMIKAALRQGGSLFKYISGGERQ